MKKNTRTLLTAGALVGVLLIGGVAAYLSDGDTATNKIAIGEVSIDLQEPSWKEPTKLVPNEEVAKDPQIVNDSSKENDAFVFLEVTVPYQTGLITAKDDGTRNAAADTELFGYTLNSNWTEIKGIGSKADNLADKSKTAKNSGNTDLTMGFKDESKKTITHLYAYTGGGSVMKALAKGSKTEAVFPAVKFANIIEDQGLEGTTKNIVLNAYAIQASFVNNADSTIDGTSTAGKTAPADVWAVLYAQSYDDAATGDFLQHEVGVDAGVSENTVTDAKETE